MRRFYITSTLCAVDYHSGVSPYLPVRPQEHYEEDVVDSEIDYSLGEVFHHHDTHFVDISVIGPRDHCRDKNDRKRLYARHAALETRRRHD